MENIQKTGKFEIKVSTLITVCLYLLILIGSMNAMESSLKIVGLLSLISTLLVSTIGILIFIFVKKNFLPLQFIILFIIIISTVVCFFSVINNRYDLKDLINTLQMLSCFNLLVFVSCIKFDYSKLKFINLFVTLFITFHFIIWIISGCPRMFASIYNNSNLIGPYMFYSSFFLILGFRYSKKKLLYSLILFMSFILILASDARSILLSVFVSIVIFSFWKYISKSQILSFIFFILLISAILMFVFVYPILPTFSFFNSAEQWMVTHTGKSIMSGRNVLWVPLIEMINQKLFLGYGPGTLASDLIATDQSPHNLYLNILMQIGYIGLFLNILLFLVIWHGLTKLRNNFIARLVGSYFVGILVHQSFEITLFQNLLSVGLLQWFILAVGLSVVIETSLSKNHK